MYVSLDVHFFYPFLCLCIAQEVTKEYSMHG